MHRPLEDGEVMMSLGYTVTKYSIASGADAYTVLRLGHSERVLVRDLSGDAAPLHAVAAIILRDIGHYPSGSELDELVRAELAPLNDVRFGIRTVTTRFLRAWLEERARRAPEACDG